jgi:hypothetical protein
VLGGGWLKPSNAWNKEEAMNCDVITDLMPAYESGSASAKTRQLVEEHLVLCPTCLANFGVDSPDGEISDLPTPPRPDERAALLRIQSGIFGFFNLLFGVVLFLGNAAMVLLVYFGLYLSYWQPSPREVRIGFPGSALPTVWEVLLLVGILLGLRWAARRYPPDRVPTSTSSLYLGVAWLALLGLALLSLFTTGTATPVFALWLALALSLSYVRWTPRLALGSISILMLITMSVVTLWAIRVFQKLVATLS